MDASPRFKVGDVLQWYETPDNAYHIFYIDRHSYYFFGGFSVFGVPDKWGYYTMNIDDCDAFWMRKATTNV